MNEASLIRGLRVVSPSRRDPRWAQIASLGAFTVIGHTQLDFQISLLQLAAVVATCLLTDVALGLRRRHLLVPASGLISGLSLGLLLRGSGLGIYVVAGLATALSKELIRARGRHVFNPSNFGLVFVLLLFGSIAGTAPGQWGSSWVLVFLVVNAGVFVIYSVRRFHVVVAFYVTYVAAEVVRLGMEHRLSELDDRVFTASVLLFAFFMITDPRTSPSTTPGRIAYAAITSVVAVALESLGLEGALFFSLAAVCTLVPLIEAATERRGGQLLQAFEWPGSNQQEGDPAEAEKAPSPKAVLPRVRNFLSPRQRS